MTSFVEQLPDLTSKLDDFSKLDKTKAAKNLANAGVFLVYDLQSSKVYPIYWLLHVQSGKPLSGKKGSNRSLERERPELISQGYIELSEGEIGFQEAWSALNQACQELDTKPSRRKNKSNWSGRRFFLKQEALTELNELAVVTVEQIQDAIEVFKNTSSTNEPRSNYDWYFFDNKYKEPFPVNAIMDIVTQSTSQVESGLKDRNRLSALGFTCLELSRSYDDASFEMKVEASRVDSREKRLARLKDAEHRPKRLVRQVLSFNRNPDVVAERLYLANGKCNKCQLPAPFNRKSDGRPYLEVHHKVSLSDNGHDTVANTEALCANCHRQKHFG